MHRVLREWPQGRKRNTHVTVGCYAAQNAGVKQSRASAYPHVVVCAPRPEPPGAERTHELASERHSSHMIDFQSMRQREQ